MIATISEPVSILKSSATLWFAIRTKPRCELMVARALRRKGLECFLPLQSSGDFDEVLLPLFERTVFCCFDLRSRLGVLTAPGVVEIVGSWAVPLPVEDRELAALRMVAESGWRLRPWPYTPDGPRARIKTGPMAGLEGIWAVGKSGGQFVLSIHALQYSAAIEIDQQSIQMAA